MKKKIIITYYSVINIFFIKYKDKNVIENKENIKFCVAPFSCDDDFNVLTHNFNT